MKVTTVNLPTAYIEGLDQLVRSGHYQSRAAAIRSALHDLLDTEIGLHNIYQRFTRTQRRRQP